MAHTASLVLADLVNEPDGGKGEGFGKAAPVALIVIVVFFIAVVFLVRSMTKHLKKVPPGSFDPAERERMETDAAAAEEAAEESGQPPPDPPSSLRGKAFARAEARARAEAARKAAEGGDEDRE